MARKITVITADIVMSRDLGLEQEPLKEKLELVNRAIPELLVPFSLSRGDEVQGILAGWLTCPAVLRRLRYQLLPISLRIGVGLGFATEIADNSWEMNGVPFFRAREALDQCKLGGASTELRSGRSELDRLGNGIFTLLDSLRRTWSDEQWQAVHAYERLGTFLAVGKSLGISAQAAHKRCQAARWHDYLIGENAVVEIGQLLAALSVGIDDTVVSSIL